MGGVEGGRGAARRRLAVLAVAGAVGFSGGASAQTVDPAVFDVPGDRLPEVTERGRRQEAGFQVVDLSFEGPAGPVPLHLYLPDDAGPAGPRPGIILMHGLPGTRENVAAIAAAYARAGAVVAAPTGPTGRTGGPSLSLTPRDRDRQVHLIQELRQVVDLLATHPRVDGRRLAYVGFSYGGAMGGLLAGVEDRIAAFVLAVGDGGLVDRLTGPDDADGPLSHLPRKRREAWIDAMEPVEPRRWVGGARAPILFQNATDDTLVPRIDAEAWHAAGPDHAEVVWYEGGHALGPEAFRDQARWLARHVGLDALRFRPPVRGP